MIEVVFDDILRQDVDVIVNPANTHMLHGGGLARTIAVAAGGKMVKESQDQAPIPTGSALITTAGKLPFKAVIHAVGPVWEADDDAPYWRQNSSKADPDELLADAYAGAIALAAANGHTSIAFPAISCGVFRFPVRRAAPIAIKAVRGALRASPEVERVVFCLLDEEHYQAFVEAEAAT